MQDSGPIPLSSNAPVIVPFIGSSSNDHRFLKVMKLFDYSMIFNLNYEQNMKTIFKNRPLLDIYCPNLIRVKLADFASRQNLSRRQSFQFILTHQYVGL